MLRTKATPAPCSSKPFQHAAFPSLHLRAKAKRHGKPVLYWITEGFQHAADLIANPPTLSRLYSHNAMSDAIKQLAPAQAFEYNSSGKWKYLDVRTPEEFAEGHAPGAINVPFMLRLPQGMTPNPTFAADVAAEVPDKGAALLVGCRSGARSSRALQVLVAEGYSQLAHNSNGFDAWRAAGLPVES